MENYYKLLGINAKADRDEVRKAYYKKLKQYHPDVYKGDKVFAESMTSRLTEAYKVLRDDDLKKEHDKQFGTYKVKKEKSKNTSTKATVNYYYASTQANTVNGNRSQQNNDTNKVNTKSKSVFQSIKEEVSDAWFRYFTPKKKVKNIISENDRKNRDKLSNAIYILFGLLILLCFVFLIVR